LGGAFTNLHKLGGPGGLGCREYPYFLRGGAPGKDRKKILMENVDRGETEKKETIGL